MAKTIDTEFVSFVIKGHRWKFLKIKSTSKGFDKTWGK